MSIDALNCLGSIVIMSIIGALIVWDIRSERRAEREREGNHD